MIQLRIKEILSEKGKSKYWLNKKMGNMCYRNFNNLVTNNTKSIRFDTLDKLSKALDVPVGELFEEIPDEEEF
ncbi:MAG: helix-turn-helix transcriptional regulator, partial [Lachnospiraceae bacterium]|nr:helix-turn-helix transcriptional regulator [Lachnospiraceae bacterium]